MLKLLCVKNPIPLKKVPPMSELQAMWWICRMQNRVNMIPDPSLRSQSYTLLGGKYPYGVDYGNYMHRIAEDIGAAPTLSDLLLDSGDGGDGDSSSNTGDDDNSPIASNQSKNNSRRWFQKFLVITRNNLKSFYTYCMGQAHVPLFRMKGPFRSESCRRIVYNELWDVCIHRGVLENVGLFSVLILSLWMNLTACLIELVWCLVTLRTPVFFARY